MGAWFVTGSLSDGKDCPAIFRQVGCLEFAPAFRAEGGLIGAAAGRESLALQFGHRNLSDMGLPLGNGSEAIVEATKVGRKRESGTLPCNARCH